jgi:hypothetical protein
MMDFMPSLRAAAVVVTLMAIAVGGGYILFNDSTPPPPGTQVAAGPVVEPPGDFDRGSPNPPHFGMNLASIADWSREWAFVDVFKSSRPWTESANGRQTYMVRELEGHYPAGRYVVTWKGAGEVNVPGFDVVKETMTHKPDRLECDVRPADGGLQLVVDSDRRDPVRDLHAWMPGFEGAKSPFHPLFMERLAPFEVIRFMKWQRTETTTASSWDQRAKPDDERWSTDAGVPPEVMIDLANARRAHPWFCMPHLADDNYVRRFARLVKQRLRPDLKAYVEYSNEVWNWIYPTTHYADAEGKRLKLGDPAFGRFYAQRSVEVFHIWEEELGRNRLVRVLASQFANPWLTEQVLTWKDAYKHADALAVAPYFGHEFGRPEAAPAVATLTAPQLLDRLAAEVDGKNRELIQTQVALARKYGLPLIAYEGGQHLAGVGAAANDDALTALFVSANRNPRMGEITRRHYANWFAAGGGLYVAFVFAERPGKFGSWGVLEYQEQPPAEAPKYRAILDMLQKSK